MPVAKFNKVPLQSQVKVYRVARPSYIQTKMFRSPRKILPKQK